MSRHQERWLNSGRRRSEHTRRTYRQALMQWREFTLEQLGIMHLWQVQPGHVQQWINHLTQQGNEQAHDRRTAGRLQLLLRILRPPDQYARRARSISLFDRCLRQPTAKPVHGQQHRPPEDRAVLDAQQVPPEAYRWIITDLAERNKERPCSENLRNNALMLTFGFNGWRNEEVLTMTWGKVS